MKQILLIQAAIFDLDGTLTHFNLDFKTLRADVRSYLIRVGVPVSVLNVNESIFDMLAKTEIFFKNSDNPGDFEATRSQALAIAEKYEMEAARTTNLLPGASEVLSELNRMKLKLALCSTSSEKSVNYILEHFKIGKFFSVVVPRNRVRYVKPHTEEFELALKELNVTASAALVVGDGIVDMKGAKELKAVAVGFPTGLFSAEQLERNGANYIITSLTDLTVLIKEINKA